MNTPPTKQAKQEYVNPFGAPTQMPNDPNVKLYPKLEVQDNLTRIVQGKDPRLKLNNPGDFEGSHSAYSAMNQQIAHSLLAKNSEQLKLLQVKPELQAVGAESPQKYAPHAQLSKPQCFQTNVCS